MKIIALSSRIFFNLISLFFAFGAIIMLLANDTADSINMKEIVAEKYKAWYKYCLGKSHSSNPNTYLDNAPFREIVALGIPAVPYLIREESKYPLSLPVSILFAVELITKAKLHMVLKEENGRLIHTIVGFPYFSFVSSDKEDILRNWLRWWHGGRKEIPQYFDTLYVRWKELKDKGKKDEAEERYQQIRNMGIIVLPYLIEKIAGGDTSLIPTVFKLTDGAVKVDAKPEECIEWWNKNKEKWYIPIEDEPIEKEEKEIKEDEK